MYGCRAFTSPNPAPSPVKGTTYQLRRDRDCEDSDPEATHPDTHAERERIQKRCERSVKAFEPEPNENANQNISCQKTGQAKSQSWNFTGVRDVHFAQILVRFLKCLYQMLRSIAGS
jgi:hypothetical protein